MSVAADPGCPGGMGWLGTGMWDQARMRRANRAAAQMCRWDIVVDKLFNWRAIGVGRGTCRPVDDFRDVGRDQTAMAAGDGEVGGVHVALGERARFRGGSARRGFCFARWRDRRHQ